MGAQVQFIVSRAGIESVLKGDGSMAARALLDLARQVERQAKLNVPVDTGRLRGAIRSSMTTEAGKPVALVRAETNYAIFVHEGTGLYGPRHQRIVPTAPKTLFRWTDKSAPGGVRFARSTRGVRPRPFLRDALETVTRGA